MSESHETPRTDAAAIRIPTSRLYDMVPISFARQLERELAQCRADWRALDKEQTETIIQLAQASTRIIALESRLAAAERDAQRWQALVDLWALGTLTLELSESGFYKAHIEIPGEGASLCIESTAEEIVDSSREEWIDAALQAVKEPR